MGDLFEINAVAVCHSTSSFSENVVVAKSIEIVVLYFFFIYFASSISKEKA